MSNRDTNVSVQADPTEKELIEAVSYDILDCSQSAGLKHIAEQFYRQVAGDIHPRAIRDEKVDVQALLNGNLEPEDVDEKYRMDGDSPAQIPTADGGLQVTPTPSSYTPTYTPQDLATTGAELTWDELTDAIGQHWSDDLEIHEDRVRSSGDVEIVGDGKYSDDPYALRASKKPVAKILAGILRSNGDVVPEKLVEAKILQYTEHQISRADESEGRRYKKSEYKRLLVKKGHLVPHPDPLRDEYYTSEAAAKERFAEEVKETIADLVEKTWVLDPTEHVQQTGIAVKENAEQWVRDLAEFRQGLGFLHTLLEDDDWSDRLSELDDPLGEWPNAKVAAGKTYNQMLSEYVYVNQWARFAAADAVLELEDDELLEDDLLRDDEWVPVRPDRPSEPVFEWVADRDKPLSPQAQIAEVSNKL
ncbi:hypothetical protein A6E15_19390 [Natrinema saccharevitans]|uniref:Uncharacterized protein n=1 Tax=Natrinema saccharevitans TaxID=301967 RepID=A0A1S8ARH4_9EURY|nr:hypothetical protein [Natrinema saccharevitans]OLZ39129.1 hypothetical protein A6E15_19390 [Natrinema saccharevitans]